MTSKDGQSQVAVAAPGDPRSQLAERIAASRAFSKSPRLREFLLFVTERTVQGDLSAVNEIEIAHRIFGRGADFVPTEDSVVRVSARQLRTKLKEYFEDEGRLEPIQLEIPKGAYIPAFHPREPIPPEPPPLSHPSQPLPVRWRLALSAAILLNVALLFTVVVLLRRSSPAPPVPDTAPSLLSVLLSRANTPVHVVVSDFSLSLMRGLSTNGNSYDLDEYLAWNYRPLQPVGTTDPRVTWLWNVLRTHRITRLGDLTLLASIERTAGQRVPILVRDARDVSLRDFQSGWHVVLGNPYSTPWVSLFEDQLEFRSVRDKSHGVGFLNHKPRPGETGLYSAANAEREDGVGYARVAFVPNSSGRPGVLLIGGINMVSMEAAGDFLAHPDSIRLALAALGLDRLDPLPYFELLLQTRALDNTPQGAKIVASHLLDHTR